MAGLLVGHGWVVFYRPASFLPPAEKTCIDPKTASVAEWAALPGVGPKLAKRIVQFCAQRGGVRTLDELLLVRGVGPKTLDRLRPYIRDALPRQRKGSPHAVRTKQ